MSAVVTKMRDRMTMVLNIGLMVTVALLVVDVIWGVFTRYMLGHQAQWTEELARFLLIWVSLLGGAAAFGSRAHLGVDYFVGKLHPQARKLMMMLGHILVLVFAGGVLLYGGGKVVAEALALKQTTPALGWQMGYVYLALPVAGVFVVVYTIENLILDMRRPADGNEESEGAEG